MNATEEGTSAGYRTRYRLSATLALAGSLSLGAPGEWLHASSDLPAVAPETPINETGASYLPYDTGVTKGGDAYVTVPIDPGPRPPGLSPGLQIRYLGGRERNRHHLQEPRDSLGYGWFVGGVSHVGWCMKGERAGQRRLKVDASDPLCVANRRLVLARDKHLRPGAEYRTLLERFERVVVRGGPALSDIWFELLRPDGLIAEYGRTPDSRLLLQATKGDESAQASNDLRIPFAWSLNRLANPRAEGDEVRFEYYEDEKAGIRRLKRTVFGRGDSVEMRFRYATRRDVSTVVVGKYELTERLRLHRVEILVGGEMTREYRLESERTETGWQRLRRIQLCFASRNDRTPCLTPLVIDWIDPPVELPYVRTLLARVESPHGTTTSFNYGMHNAREGADFVFGGDESPFGASAPTADVRESRVSPKGYVKAVVTDFVATTDEEKTEHVRYGYQGPFWESVNNWGTVGFTASSMTDVTTGQTTYTQYRLDFPYFGQPSAQVVYDSYFRPGLKPLAESFALHDAHTIEHGNARVVLPYVKTATVPTMHEGQRVVLQSTVEELSLSDTAIESVTRRYEVGTSATPIRSETWGATEYRLNDVFDSHVQEEVPNDANAP